MKIYDFNECPLSDRNGTYGGNAGSKEGILINGEYWIAKYPKSTRGMRGVLNSYTTSPLSEYIGSHVYEILGIDTHKTELGIRKGKLIVACKDFCVKEGELREIRTLKNIYNEQLENELDKSLSSTDSSIIPIEQLLIHFEYNPVIKDLKDIKERFWDMFIVDVLINNNDRNNGNWGALYRNGEFILSPVYDNGSSFSNKLPDSKIKEYLENNDKMMSSINGCVTAYSYNNIPIKASDISNLSLLYEQIEFRNEACKMITTIEERFPLIKDFVSDIPDSFEGYSICSDIRKEFYIHTMQLRLERFLQPALANVYEYEDSLTRAGGIISP